VRVKLVVLAGIVAALVGCGGSSHGTASTTTAATPRPPGHGQVLYAGGPWAVVVHGAKATAYHLVAGRWHADRSGTVRITVLGPRPGTVAAPLPQVAAELRAPAPLVESGIWVDGKELAVKGGGLTPKRGTIYGAPAGSLKSGRHVAVAYARTDAHATAVAWTFRV
jgi:hypothetical protein